MEFYTKLNAELEAQNKTLKDLNKILHVSTVRCMEIATGRVLPYQSEANRICQALGFEWDISTLPISKHNRGLARPDTMAEDNRNARELGLSYGQYMSYKETGYLESYIKQLEKDKKRKVNVIVSPIGGGRGGGRRSDNSTKL